MKRVLNSHISCTTKLIALLACGAVLVPTFSGAATQTSNLSVSATVPGTCQIGSIGTLSFGSYDFTQNKDASTTIQVTCTNGTDVNVGLGSGGGSSVTSRRMSSVTASSSTLNYGLYSNSGRTQNWGETVGNDVLNYTSDGSLHTMTVYGRIPSGQPVKPATDYSDTVQVTVTFTP
ncbi:MAG: spore coat U domain-containing protein [Proteobacteria bacterium]|nr:spore coat U domain-containing protein [Pseudomonadota bacterium]